MKIRLAKTIAREWVDKNAGQIKGFKGAYFSGSIVGADPNGELAQFSDVDVVVVTEAAKEAPPKLGKFLYKGILLEVTYIPWNQLSSAKQVLGTYYLAGSFRTNTIIRDPDGHLEKLQLEVSRQFGEEAWVRYRCNKVFEKIENGIRGIDTSALFPDLVLSWLFPTGVTTHVLLVAGLKNPTVRLRYPAARKVLTEYDEEEFYPELLDLLGCTHLSARQVEEHLQRLDQTFDAAVSVSRTPFFFSSDITPEAKFISIDGSRELIRAGYHHEAIFWIGATFARCHKILAVDGTQELQAQYIGYFKDFIKDLGIVSPKDFIYRGEKVIEFFPRLREVTEGIIFKNPYII